MDSSPSEPPRKQISFVKILFYYVNCLLYIKFCSCLPSVYLGLQNWTSNLFSILLLRQLNSSNARSFTLYTALLPPTPSLAKHMLSSRSICFLTSIEIYSLFLELHRTFFKFPSMLPPPSGFGYEFNWLMSEKILFMNHCLVVVNRLG